jgi:hypothetical protein
MSLPSTKPLDGMFWYVLDDQGAVAWRPVPELRGDFYLGWLGQNRTVVGAGLVCMEKGRLARICTHGTPYYWLQAYEVLPFTSEALRAQQISGADSMELDFSLAGWGIRDQTLPEPRLWSDAPVSGAVLEPLLVQAVSIIAQNYRSEGEPPSKPGSVGLLARATSPHSVDPLDDLLEVLKTGLGESNVVPSLIELVRYDLNVLPSYRQSDFFESLSADEKLPPPSKVARLVISVIYHLAPLLGSRRLNSILLLNDLRQRHPFDVTWGADSLVKCFGMPGLVHLLLAALHKEQNDQIRGNVFDLLQELGYGLSVSLEDEVLKGLGVLLDQAGLGAFEQVVHSHLVFVKEYLRLRDTAARSTG